MGLKVGLRQGAAKVWVRYKKYGGNAVRDSYNTLNNIDYGGEKTGFVFNNHMQSNKYAVAAIADAQIYRGLFNRPTLATSTNSNFKSTSASGFRIDVAAGDGIHDGVCHDVRSAAAIVHGDLA